MTYKWEILHVWTSHVTHINETCQTWNETCQTCEPVMSHIQLSLFAQKVCLMCMHVWCVLCAVSPRHSYMEHDSSTCVDMTHTFEMTHSYTWHDSFIRGTWFVCIYDMTDPYMGHDSLVYVTYTVMSLIHYMWHDMTRNESVMSLIHYEWHDMTSSLLFRTFLWVCVCLSLSLPPSLCLPVSFARTRARRRVLALFPPLFSLLRAYTHTFSLSHTHTYNALEHTYAAVHNNTYLRVHSYIANTYIHRHFYILLKHTYIHINTNLLPEISSHFSKDDLEIFESAGTEN